MRWLSPYRSGEVPYDESQFAPSSPSIEVPHVHFVPCQIFRRERSLSLGSFSFGGRDSASACSGSWGWSSAVRGHDEPEPGPANAGRDNDYLGRN